MRHWISISVILLIFVFGAKAQNPCTITVSINSGCIPLPVKFTFSTTNSSPVATYLWDFGDGDSSSQASPTHIYKAHGNYYGKVTVTFANHTTCTVTITKPITIFSSPNADFNYGNNQKITLCNPKTPICFKDLSTPGSDHAPINSWLWSFGDGSSSTSQNPCYSYSAAGTYTVTLEVVDTNGCKNFIQKVITVIFQSGSGLNLAPRFIFNNNINCKNASRTVTFKNVTDTNGMSITKFIWNFGDGTGDTCTLADPTCLTKWLSQVHTYAANGTYFPSLYIENRSGCTASYTNSVVINASNYKISFSISPQKACFVQDSVVFFSTPANNVAWDFGDPYNRGIYTFPLPTIKFYYNRPGTYTVYYGTVHNGCPYDSIICKAVTLYGPIAKIMPFKGKFETWNIAPPNGNYLISPASFKSYFDTICPGSAIYYTYTPTLKKNGEAVYDNCLMDTVHKLLSPDSLIDCNGKNYADTVSIYSHHIDSQKDTTIQVATMHIWSSTSPRPTGPVYSAPPYIGNPLMMDDTSLFSLRCKAPFQVKFTNFSIKYRGYDAVDDFPLNFPDVCIHKTYPYASDSLNYFWNFKEGNGNISTVSNPDAKAQYSKEKMPTHLFEKDGCYMVIMQATDPVTGCTDIDSLPVVLQEPDAGWAPQYSNIKDMTRHIQDSLPTGGPRRGFIYKGLPCQGNPLTVDLNETLPGCFKNSYAVVTDSAHQVGVCGNPSIKKFSWISKAILTANNNIVTYADTGWKTIGLVISNNANCTDTVWYHNYIYIHSISGKLYLSKNHICAGDDLKMSPAFQDQPGIQIFTLSYANDPGPGIKPDSIKKYVFNYQMVTRPGGKMDTVTSTSNNYLFGKDDSPLKFNYLKDTVVQEFDQPGHWSIESFVYSRYGCSIYQVNNITVGHYSNLTADNSVICVNDTVHFTGTALYYSSYTSGSNGIDSIPYWQNPVGVRHGRVPMIPEKMEWDLDGDGIIDYVGINPSFKYTKTGSYTITMYSYDSTGCGQKTIYKDYIKVIDATANFKVGLPGNTRYCSGSHFFSFIDSSYITKAFKDSLHQFHITSWTWDFGDGSAPITITDSTKKNVGHVYIKNGDYIVTLTVKTTLKGTSGTLGCSNSMSLTVHILGPTSSFSIEGPVEGCVPFTLKVHDMSLKAKVHEYLLGDGTSVTSNGDSIVYLTYKHPGVWCPQLFVADTLLDDQGRPLYCADTFPVKCAIKVYVDLPNIQTLKASDTLLCVNTDTAFFQSVPDTGYKTWTINFGNGDSITSTQPNFKYVYHKIGKYHVTITGTGAKCPVPAAIDVRVIDIKGDFGIDTSKKDTPVFYFNNLSKGATHYTWDFGDGSPVYNTSSADPVSHAFMKSGKVTICLTAFNEKDCPDPICKDITINTFLFIPNVFTPNGDIFNSRFVIEIWGSTLYDLTIYNRWGQQLFHSNDKNKCWDGIDQSNGKLCPDGAYYYKFKYHLIGDKMQDKSGAVTLIRGK